MEGTPAPGSKIFDAMALKTVIKAALGKYGPLSVDMQNAVTKDQSVIAENGEPSYPDNAVEVEITSVQSGFDEDDDDFDFEAVGEIKESQKATLLDELNNRCDEDNVDPGAVQRWALAHGKSKLDEETIKEILDSWASVKGELTA